MRQRQTLWFQLLTRQPWQLQIFSGVFAEQRKRTQQQCDGGNP